MARKRDTSRPALPGPGGTAHLTPRQAEVLELAIRGLGDKEIAAYLGISRRTVEDRFDEMRERTGTRTRTELAACAAEAGLVQPATGNSRATPGQDRVDPNCPGSGHGVGNRTILRHPPRRAPIVISGRRRQPEKRVEKPACPTTPAPPFPVRSEGDADPGRPRRRRSRLARARAGEPDRRADRVRPGLHVRAEPGPADPRPDRGRLHPDLRRQAVGQDRRPARARRVPGLPPRRRHPGRAEPGPAVPVPAGPDRHRGRAAPPRGPGSGPFTRRWTPSLRAAGWSSTSSRPWPSSSASSS